MGIFDELKGSFGELLAKYYSKLVTDALVLHDIIIDGADGMTSQIDLILIGVRGVYVVEVKNYPNAYIYGDGKKSRWSYYMGGKKYDIYSPILQNKHHIKYLKESLKEFGDIPYFSLILMICEDFKVSNINQNEEKKDILICGSLPAMKRGLNFFIENYPIVLSEEQKQQIYEHIMNIQHEGKEARIKHKQQVKEIKNSYDELQQQNMCPYCKKELALRKGKYGEFYGCTNYPRCKFTKKIK